LLREAHKQARHDDKQPRQQHRALDEHDLVARPARKVNATGGLDPDLEAEEVDGGDDRDLNRREPREELPARPGQQTADADPQKAREQDEVGEVRQQPDVCRQPSNERDLEKEDEKGGEEDPQ
jgi:hypothetical protein